MNDVDLEKITKINLESDVNSFNSIVFHSMNVELQYIDAIVFVMLTIG